jgi:hypothetical protein
VDLAGETGGDDRSAAVRARLGEWVAGERPDHERAHVALGVAVLAVQLEQTPAVAVRVAGRGLARGGELRGDARHGVRADQAVPHHVLEHDEADVVGPERPVGVDRGEARDALGHRHRRDLGDERIDAALEVHYSALTASV